MGVGYTQKKGGSHTKIFYNKIDFQVFNFSVSLFNFG